MSTAQEIIQAAYREGNLIPAGKQPTTDELVESLRLLNAYIRALFGFEMGENLADWQSPAPQRTAPVAANYPQLPYPTDAQFGITTFPLANDPSANIYPYPPANSRIVFGKITMTAYFPEQPNDGARMALVEGTGLGDSGTDGQIITLDGNGRTIEGDPTQAYVAPVDPRAWFYRADLADWVALIDMELADDMPFPGEFDDMFACALAIRLAPRYGKTTAPETAGTFKTKLAQFKARYRQTAVTVYGSSDFPHTYQAYNSGPWWPW